MLALRRRRFECWTEPIEGLQLFGRFSAAGFPLRGRHAASQRGCCSCNSAAILLRFLAQRQSPNMGQTCDVSTLHKLRFGLLAIAEFHSGTNGWAHPHFLFLLRRSTARYGRWSKQKAAQPMSRHSKPAVPLMFAGLLEALLEERCARTCGVLRPIHIKPEACC